jgi:hypothetical protein
MALCSALTYCISSGGNPYDGQYSLVGTYNGYDYYSGDSVSYYIYFSTGSTVWCLSTSLGGSCNQFGQVGSFTVCPDLDEGFFTSGSCPTTTTTTTSPCDVFDFEAIFDCMIPTTTTTTTIPPTTTTTTTLPFDPCTGVSVNAAITAYTTTTTTIPVTTTTTTIIRPCNFDGLAQFNLFDEFMRCGNAKRFRDCITGFNYYTNELIYNESGETLTQNYVYKTTINGLSACVTFMGLVDNISGADDIVIVETLGLESAGACLSCLPDPPPPPPPCDCYVLLGFSPAGGTFSIIDCDSNPTTYSVARGATGYTCSLVLPTLISGNASVYINSGSCDTVVCAPEPPSPPVPCTPYTYHVANTSPVGGLTFTFTDCNGVIITGGPLGPYDSENVCSTTLPIGPTQLSIGLLEPPIPCV